jgi:2-amino-4-hydroxy-6-hydroxymethyldihydropteridine diphosphokinase
MRGWGPPARRDARKRPPPPRHRPSARRVAPQRSFGQFGGPLLSACAVSLDCRSPLADGRWPLAARRSPLAGGRWPVAGGRWPVAGGRWPMAGGRWPLAGGRWPAPCAARGAPRGAGWPLADDRSPLAGGRLRSVPMLKNSRWLYYACFQGALCTPAQCLQFFSTANAVCAYTMTLQKTALLCGSSPF